MRNTLWNNACDIKDKSLLRIYIHSNNNDNGDTDITRLIARHFISQLNFNSIKKERYERYFVCCSKRNEKRTCCENCIGLYMKPYFVIYHTEK